MWVWVIDGLGAKMLTYVRDSLDKFSARFCPLRRSNFATAMTQAQR